MLDFFKIRTKSLPTKNTTVIYPDFIVGRHKDLMIRGGVFYAVFNEETGLWSTDEFDVADIVDRELWNVYDKMKSSVASDATLSVESMREYDSKSWTRYKKFVRDMPDDYVLLDTKLAFSGQIFKRENYVSKYLPYNLNDAACPAWDELIGTLYSEDERRKIEWGIGSIVAGDSVKISKFFVLYGDPGSGKGTVLDIIVKMFEGYTCFIEAHALGNQSSVFSTAAFKDNPLVALEYDSDLSKIETNTRLNSIVAHETIKVRDLYQSAYNLRINAMIFLATNSPVQITDAKSGIIRRLIDVNPSGNRIPSKRYQQLVRSIDFELGAIAKHCMDIYNKYGKHYYDSYRSTDMMERTDIFFNFVSDYYFDFKNSDLVSLKRAWAMYTDYISDSGLKYSMPRYKFKQELKNYFEEYLNESRDADGKHIRNVYRGFKAWMIDSHQNAQIVASESGDADEEISTDIPDWLELYEHTSSNCLLDDILADCPAQYATDAGSPYMKWANVHTTLRELDTHKLHFLLLLDGHHIIVDFDIRDLNTGEKSLELNLKAASKFPPTYAEVSKSGGGLHLHYFYDGDVDKLRPVYAEGIEVKVYKGNSSLRRCLSLCNDIPVATINSGLPLRESKKVLDKKVVKSEEKLRELISRCLSKEFGSTKVCVQFIDHLLNQATETGMIYDVSNMKQAIMIFAMNSTNNSEYCMKLASKMPYKSEEHDNTDDDYADDRLVFFDVEVFPNLFLVNWKFAGSDSCVRMINPTPEEIGSLFKYKLVGFNNRRYDNHILYGRYIGYDNEELYTLSQKIVGNSSQNSTFLEAYNISYTDVYDFASAGHKMSLKKWEIKLGLHHQELGLPWDQPVPEDQWGLVAEYCDNDVISTEAVFNHLHGDFRAREILADLADMTVNDSTNALTTRIIFGREKKPKLNWTDLSELFPGYEYKHGHNMYRGDDVGRGGWVYANPGMYKYCKTFDVASMHPRSIIELRYLGEYTDRFEDLVNIRLYIKHGDYDSVAKLFDGKLAKYLSNKDEAKQLSNALKTAINSVYGMTSATYSNPFRDIRNKNNIVALRGALFMRTLQDEVESRGFKVIHIKTDSIKVADPTPEIEEFIYSFGEKYGYTFEVEAEWEKLCLVNNAVFIGKQTVKSPQKPGEWTATGAQFAQPYVFKTLFSHEPITFDDKCVTMTCKSAFYLNMNENLPEGDSMPIFVGRAGSFCPIKSGCGGGELMRLESDGRMSYASGTKGYRWREAELVRGTDDEADVDTSYFDHLVDEAVADISNFGDYNWFVDDHRNIPFYMPCGDSTIDNCFECPHYHCNQELCDLNFDISDILLSRQQLSKAS